jgi:hypothetical protein
LNKKQHSLYWKLIFMNSCSVKCKIFTLVPEWFWHKLNYFSFCWTVWKLICYLCRNFHKLKL